MQFGGIIYLHDLSEPRVNSRGTHTKLSNPNNREIVPRFILATTDGNSSIAKDREKKLIDATRNVKTQPFTNSKDSAWSIVDSILHMSPTKLGYIQEELDGICDSLPKRIRKTFFGILRLLVGTSRNVNS